MSHTPAPDPTLSPKQLDHRQNQLRDQLADARIERAAITVENIPDIVKRTTELRKSNTRIATLVDTAFHSLGIPKKEIAQILHLSRQGLDNVVKAAVQQAAEKAAQQAEKAGV